MAQLQAINKVIKGRRRRRRSNCLKERGHAAIEFKLLNLGRCPVTCMYRNGREEGGEYEVEKHFARQLRGDRQDT